MRKSLAPALFFVFLSFQPTESYGRKDSPADTKHGPHFSNPTPPPVPTPPPGWSWEQYNKFRMMIDGIIADPNNKKYFKRPQYTVYRGSNSVAPYAPKNKSSEIIEPDVYFDSPMTPPKTITRIFELLEKFDGVNGEERQSAAFKAVGELAKIGEAASPYIAVKAQNADLAAAEWCLRVMERAWTLRYQSVLLHLLEHRSELPPALGETALRILRRFNDPSGASRLVRLLLRESDEKFNRDVAVLLWENHGPNIWARVLKSAGLSCAPKETGEILAQLRGSAATDRLAAYFTEQMRRTAGGDNDEDVFIVTANRKPADEALVRRLAAMVLGWSARAEQRDALTALAADMDVEVALYGWLGKARLRLPEAMPPLVNYLAKSGWNLRCDAQEGLTLLTGKDLDFDFAASPEERINGIGDWRHYLEIKDAGNVEKYPDGAGWTRVPLRFVVEPRAATLDVIAALNGVGRFSKEPVEGMSADILTPGILEGRFGFVSMKSGLGSFPVSLAGKRTLRLKADDKNRAPRIAWAAPGTPAESYKPMLFSGVVSRPLCMELEPIQGQKTTAAYVFGRFDPDFQGVSFVRAGWLEGRFGDIRLRIYDDDHNGEFDDYGADAIVVGGRKYGTLLSSLVMLNERPYEFRVDRGGESCRVRAYQGRLGKFRLNLPESFPARLLNVQAQSGAVCLDVTEALERSVAMPPGKYRIVHAVVAGAGGVRALIVNGKAPEGEFVVEADKTAQFTFAAELKLELNARVGSRFDDEAEKKYPIPPGGGVLKADAPLLTDGGRQQYVRFTVPLPAIKIEMFDAKGARVFSDMWSGSGPYFRVLTSRAAFSSGGRITAEVVLPPLGKISGETALAVP